MTDTSTRTADRATPSTPPPSPETGSSESGRPESGRPTSGQAASGQPASGSPTTARERQVADLPDALLLRMHDLMLKARVLEERLIRMQKQGDGYFWIGGPGEEAFNTALGLLVQKGEGLDFDYTHLHYRSSATLLAMGADPVDALRQMRMLATDPHSGGRNFVGHYSVREWNVCPITSPIEVQYSMAIGTARAQRRPACKGITIVQGGDAGTAEGDFATCLVWSSRPGNELPILIIVTNNRWGISTHASTQHGEAQVADRGKPFGIRTMTIDGNDATTAYRALEEAMEYVRTERKPLLLEAMVSRLYGHSSSSGSNYTDTEPDCLKLVGAELEARNLRSSEEAEAIRERHFVDLQEASRRIKSEPKPQPNDIWKHVFAEKGTNGDA